MHHNHIQYSDSVFFSTLIQDYLKQDESLINLYNYFPSIENFKFQIDEKSAKYNHANREIIYKTINKQYQNLSTTEQTQAHIELLKNNNCFTITTGHQLNLFCGPLYFLYKIISTIKIAQSLKKEYPTFDFVPLFWMATEDHDFEEINHFKINQKKIVWNTPSQGPVGRLSTTSLSALKQVLVKEFGQSNNAKHLIELFENAYLKQPTLSAATRYLVNELFGNQGIVVLDADEVDLKKIITPYFKKELVQQIAFEQINASIKNLKDYKIQVNPREINLFYIQDNLRERIVNEGSSYKVLNTKLIFSETEILEELEKHPEKFSPNVVMRPLYQEVILPNLCYVGGGGEIAYWLELKQMFAAYDVAFPILKIRNSGLIATLKQSEKLKKLQISFSDLFLPQNDLLNEFTKKHSAIKIDFSDQKNHLSKQFEALYQMAIQTDESFVGAVQAQEKKQIKGLDKLEKRLLKAQKIVIKDKLDRIVKLQNELFPNQSLQERQTNFSEFYLAYGENFIPKLFDSFQPFDEAFTVIQY